jgi:hypothetical protein
MTSTVFPPRSGVNRYFFRNTQMYDSIPPERGQPPFWILFSDLMTYFPRDQGSTGLLRLQWLPSGVFSPRSGVNLLCGCLNLRKQSIFPAFWGQPFLYEVEFSYSEYFPRVRVNRLTVSTHTIACNIFPPSGSTDSIVHLSQKMSVFPPRSGGNPIVGHIARLVKYVHLNFPTGIARNSGVPR